MSKINIHQSTISDWKEILRIRNECRHSFVSSHIISLSEHLGFMREHGANYYVARDHDQQKILGFVGVVNGDIRIAVDPASQGMGVGKRLINFIMNKPQYKNAIAKVAMFNEKSQKLFESCGFEKQFFIYKKSDKCP